MALTKKILVKGFDCEYRIIGRISADKIGNYTDISLMLYKDQEQRNIDINSYIYTINIFINGFYAEYGSAYEALRNTNTQIDIDGKPFFQDAVNS